MNRLESFLHSVHVFSQSGSWQTGLNCAWAYYRTEPEFWFWVLVVFGAILEIIFAITDS